MPEFADIKARILYGVYREVLARGDEVQFSSDDAKDRFVALSTSSHVTLKAIQSLLQEDMLEGVPVSFTISTRGLEEVDRQLEEPFSTMSRLKSDELASASSESPVVNDSSTTRVGAVYLDVPPAIVPASDRTVSLDHNGDPYRQAIAALEAAIQAFRADHHLENQIGREKNALLATLEAGRDLLNDTEVRISAVILTAVNPLKALLSRYQDAIATGVVEALAVETIERLCETAKIALKALSTLLGLA